MRCCAIDGCTDPDCMACSVPRRFASQIALQEQAKLQRTEKEAEGLKENAMAINGTKARQVRDPRFIQRKRKALRP